MGKGKRYTPRPTDTLPRYIMNVVFKINSDIVAATITEWVITEGQAIVSLSHSEYDQITTENGNWEIDGTAIAILEMTPDIRKYL